MGKGGSGSIGEHSGRELGPDTFGTEIIYGLDGQVLQGSRRGIGDQRRFRVNGHCRAECVGFRLSGAGRAVHMDRLCESRR